MYCNINTIIFGIVDKIYNLIVVVSKTEPVKIYVNGNQTHELIQPDDKKGFNGKI